jgi:hypothetical protein
MNKIVSLLFLVFFSILPAQEPTLGILKSINSNTQQLFTLSNNTYVCNAYGIIGLEKLSRNTTLNDACKKNVEKFYTKNIKAKYFSESKLYKMQMYHIEFKKNECLLFASGEKTLAELLLREGLALLQANFKDVEYLYVYTIAQENARLEQKGLWKDSIVRDCIAEIYKK